MSDKSKKIQKLQNYLEDYPDVLMAFLFGSQAKGYARSVSDWDIGIFLAGESRPREQELWGDIEGIIGKNVDLVVLNRAPARIAWPIVRTGEPLVIRDRRLYLRFLLSISEEAEAWQRTAHEYHVIFERSASLSREDREHLERIIQFFQQELSDYQRFRILTWEDYVSDRVRKRDAERWVEQLVNAVIDTAKIILASERRVIPDAYRAMVQTLGTVPPFHADNLCRELAPWTALRNILAHEYLDLRWKEISAFIKSAEMPLKAFVEKTKTFLNVNS